MKKIYLLLLLSIFVSKGFSQTAASYGFSAFSSTYASISGSGTYVGTIITDDMSAGSIPIGFSFVYCGTTYTNLAACSNGFLSLVNNTTATYANSGATSMVGSGVGMLMGYWDDLYGGYCTTSGAYYSTTGTSPNRIFTFEWKNFNAFPWTGPCACCTINFQIKLYETTNVIDFCYGTSSYSGMTATIGIANSFTDYQTLPNTTTSPTPSSTTYTISIPGHPTSNQVYRWSPNCVGSPAAITGSTFSVCQGSTITLSDATTGGTWSSVSTGVATIGATTGIVTGVSAGTSVISYVITSTGCYALATVNVNPLPSAILGTLSVCVGNNTTLSDASGTGTWTSSNTSVATIGSTTGIATGLSAGTTTIVFTLTSTGCSISAIVTVNPASAPITGTAVVCQGQTTILSNTTSGGTWTSAATTIATVGGTTGIVTGVSSGTTTITYMLPSGCYSTIIVTVNPLPFPITGSHTVCLTDVTTLTDITGGGTWSSSASTIAPIGATTGIVTGSSMGTSTITYTLSSTGCYTTFTETVNGLPSAIGGTPTLCSNTSTILTNSTPGGTWSSSATGVATINTSGTVIGVSAGNTTITYMMGTGCYATQVVTVYPIPAPILGDSMVCEGFTATVTDVTGASTWTMSPAGATIGSTTGIVTGITAGAYTITYTINATGCKLTRTFTVNPQPTPIAGVLVICDSSTTNLLDAVAGGTWTSSNTSVATINPSTGIAFGISVGTTNISYIIAATGCRTGTVLTVQPPPAPISGVKTVCPGLTTTLTDLITSGYWLISPHTTATIDSFTGVINGISAGIATVTYVLGTCSTTEFITVNPLPSSILGTPFVCTNGSTTSLTDPTSGGKWFSSNTSIATIDSISGVVTSITTGTTIITYKLSATGCYITNIVTVQPLPAPILGTDSVCLGYTTVLSDATSGGTFSSSSTSIASVGATSGLVTGLSIGITNIIYTITSTGCKVSVPFVVNPILSASISISASNGDTICAGSPNTFVTSTVNGGPSPIYQWKVNGVNVGTSSSSYTYAPVNGDIIKCVLTSNATCAIPNVITSNSIFMTVNPVTNPTVVMNSTLGDTICTGSTNNYSVVTSEGGTYPTYLWTVNWLPVGSGTTSFSYMPHNGDIIRCGMISSSPCPVPDTAFAIDTVVVKEYDTPKVAILNLGGNTACAGNSVTLTANPTLSGWGPVYYWSINGNPATVGGLEYSFMPNDSDVINLTMISNYPCPIPTDTAISTYTIRVDPIIIVTITDNYGGLVPQGYADTLVAHTQNAGDDPTYQWYRNGTIIPGATYYKLVRTDFNNKDSITCIVRTGSGTACEGVRGYNWIVLQVVPAGIVNIGSELTNVKLVPNPNKGSFTIEGSLIGTDDDVTFEIVDVLGQIVYKETMLQKAGHFEQSVNLDNNIADGVYMLHIISGGNSKLIRFTLKR